MKNKKVFSLVLAGCMMVSMGTPAFAEGLEELQENKAWAEAGYAEAQSDLSSLESKKQELENYLAELNAQYNELTNSVSDLGIQAAEKEEELKEIQANLEKARETAEKQYESMKLRIVYMYERGGSSMLEMLLSSKDLSQFLSRANNVSEISEYDRNMLAKYEELLQEIADQENAVEQEMTSINTLMSQRSEKQQEIQSLAASTSDSIASYVNQISATQEEADALMAEISSADSQIATLVQQAETQAQELDNAVAEEAAEAAPAEEDYGYDPSEDTTESSSSSTSTDVIVEEVDEEYVSEESGESDSEETYEESYEEDTYEETYEEETYEEESYEESSSDSGAGTYLGNFTLTAYCNCAQCCGTAGNLTASGTVPTAGHTVAMAGVPFGTQLSINGNIYTVEDLGTPYGHVDIYFDSHSDALSFGLQYADVYQVG